jgi:demethylmenaquinone methyltransferase/2-methoxy-6-polyprenyl-1,4-benzoquinol methylase
VIVPSELDPVLREQLLYYDQRAPEYDDAYCRRGQHDHGAATNESWNADMARLREHFDRVELGGDVVELAAGTGAWTERLVRRAESLTVIDGSAAMLAANRSRLGSDAARVDYQRIDLFAWRPARTWDACIFGFWLCKVPDDRAPGFLDVVSSALRPTGVVCCIDKAATIEPADERVERVLDDGRRFTIIDHPRPPERLVALFANAGMRVDVTTIGDRFCIAHGRATKVSTPPAWR